MTEQHRHDWVHAAEQPAWPTRFACTQCPSSTLGCTVCGRPLETIDRTCDECVSATRDKLRRVRDMYRALPDVIAAAAGLHAVRYDRGGRGSSGDVRVLGGEAAVLAGGGTASGVTSSARGDRSHAVDQLPSDPPSVLATLTAHEDTWRLEQQQPAATVTSVDAAVTYLLNHTAWAAQRSEVDTWLAYLSDLRTLFGRLGNLTGGSNRPVKEPTPCAYCGGVVQRRWTDGGLDDERTCTSCGESWPDEWHQDRATNWRILTAPVNDPDTLVTPEQARRALPDLKRNTLNQALKRDRDRHPDDQRIPTHGHNTHGELVYRLGDIAALTADDATTPEVHT